MTIHAIINKAVKRLELEGHLLTPDYYYEAFCKEAKIAGFDVKDCSHIQKHTESLNENFQKELKQYRINTMDEFVRFLVGKLNRTNQAVCSASLEAQINFTKRVLQVVEVLHNKEAADLARKSIILLSENPTVPQIDNLRQGWVDFITTYDDSFLNSIGIKHKNDLKKSIEEIDENSILVDSSKLNTTASLQRLSSIIISSLIPSIASSVNEQIARLSHKIKRDPELLHSLSVEDEIKKAIKLRIALDKESLKGIIESLDGVIDKLSLRLIELIERTDRSTVEIQDIKKELESYNEDKESMKNFNLAHKKLYTLAVSLEEKTKSLSSDLQEQNSEVKELSVKVKLLEEELEKAKQESKEDFLTKLHNKRALDECMTIKEAEYERHSRNFTIVMFDIDYFKSVNDTYGHDAGDAVLIAFAQILKKEARTEDVVGRFGGEEFMAILSETDTKGGFVFAEKVRKHVQQAKFMYKGTRIDVTLSAGVSERKNNSSLKQLVKSADELLYKAKQNGRNQVAYK